jgi:hypothetical protein
VGAQIVASIDRTAYPRFKRSISVRELREAYSPSLDELEWARQMTDGDEALLSLTMCLKCCQRLGYFARFDEVPASIVDHLRHELGLHESVNPATVPDKTVRNHRGLVRQATLQPFGEDGFGLVPQGPVSVLGDAGGAIGEVAGCRPRAVRAIGLEHQQRGRAVDRVGEDQVGDAGLAGRQQQMQPRIGGRRRRAGAAGGPRIRWAARAAR